MNWLYPRDVVDLLFPGMLWYCLVWIVLCCVALVMCVYYTGVACYKTILWVDDLWRRK